MENEKPKPEKEELVMKLDGDVWLPKKDWNAYKKFMKERQQKLWEYFSSGQHLK